MGINLSELKNAISEATLAARYMVVFKTCQGSKKISSLMSRRVNDLLVNKD